MTRQTKNFSFLFAILCVAFTAFAQTPMKSVQERLGYPANARLLIIHADDLGMNHSVNRATFEALEKKWITSSSILVPCPWFPEVVRWAKEHPEADLGIHQALNSEWTTERWGPVSSTDKVRSLLSADGNLPLDTDEVAKNAKPTEVETELHAQIDRAQSAGIHLTHLDTHMGALFGTTELFRVYQKMGYSYRLPILQSWEEEHGPKGVSPAKEEMLAQKVIEVAPGVAAAD